MKYTIAISVALVTGATAGLLVGIFAAAWMIGAATRKSMKASRRPKNQIAYKLESSSPAAWHTGDAPIFSST